jgi:hypothetical protein
VAVDDQGFVEALCFEQRLACAQAVETDVGARQQDEDHTSAFVVVLLGRILPHLTGEIALFDAPHYCCENRERER